MVYSVLFCSVWQLTTHPSADRDAKTEQFKAFLQACKSDATFLALVNKGQISPETFLRTRPQDVLDIEHAKALQGGFGEERELEPSSSSSGSSL